VTSHLGAMLLFAVCVAAVFGVLLRDELGAQVRLAGRIFGALAAGAYLLGWMMFLAF